MPKQNLFFTNIPGVGIAFLHQRTVDFLFFFNEIVEVNKIRIKILLNIKWLV